MADRYWVGGSGNLDGSTTTHISATSGGAGGASYPTSADNLIFDTLSNATAYTVTVTGTTNCANFVMGNPASGVITWAGSSALNFFGSFSLATGMTRTYTGAITAAGTTTGLTITVNGIVLASTFTFDGVGGSWTLQDRLISGIITITNGTLNTNGQWIRTTGFMSSNSNTRAINLGNSLLTLVNPVVAYLDFSTATGLAFNAGTSTIICVATTVSGVNALFKTNAQVFNNVQFLQAGSSTFGTLNNIISGSPTINKLFVNSNVNVQITDGTTLTVGSIVSTGTTGWPAIITGTSTGGWTLANANPGRTIATDFVNISYCTATGGGFYMGFNSTNGTGNSGLTFTDPPGSATVVLDATQPYYAPAIAATALSNATWTNARAAYLDNLSAGAVALQSSLSALITTVGVAGAGLTDVTTQVWAAGTRSLTTFGTLVADTAAAVWASAARTLTAFGFTVDTNANATESAIKAKTDNLPALPASQGDVTSAQTAIITEVDTRATPANVTDGTAAVIAGVPDNADILSQSTQGAKDALDYYGAIV